MNRDLQVQMLRRVAELRDRQAFGELFVHFAPRVTNFLRQIGANTGQAEDLMQDTMIKVWSKASLFVSDRGSVATWVFSIARNARIDGLRREKSASYFDIDQFDTPSEAASAEENLVRLQEDGLVAHALGKIPEVQRQLLILSYVEEIPQSEIAIQLKIPLGTVKSRIRLAYRRMQKLLDNDHRHHARQQRCSHEALPQLSLKTPLIVKSRTAPVGTLLDHHSPFEIICL